MHNERTESKACDPAPAEVTMYTVSGAAKELGVSLSLVYALCAAGKIRHERHGLGRGTIRISAAALEEYRRDAAVRPPGPVVRLKHLRT
jgi:excisionase family DNA binding protein